MTKTLLCGVAAIAFTLVAPTAFAQDIDMEMKATGGAEQMMEATEEAAEDAMDAVKETAEDTAEDAVDAAEDTTDDMMDDAADEMEDDADEAEDIMEDDMMDAEMDADVAVKTTASTNVACPSGTEMQGDGTCMITGDWSAED